MGCPAPKVVKNGDGSKLMLDIKKAEKIIEAVVKNTSKPVTIKIRKGWDHNNIVAVEFAQMAENKGISAITIHGRTRTDFYTGKADLEIIKKVIAIGPIMIGIYCGIEYMLWGSVVSSFIAYFLNSYYSAGLIDYPTIDQLKDILPTFLTSLTVAFIMWCVSLLDWSVYLLLPIQLVLGILLAFFIYEKIKLPEYLELKQLGISLLKRK